MYIYQNGLFSVKFVQMMEHHTLSHSLFSNHETEYPGIVS